MTEVQARALGAIADDFEEVNVRVVVFADWGMRWTVARGLMAFALGLVWPWRLAGWTLRKNRGGVLRMLPAKKQARDTIMAHIRQLEGGPVA